MSEYGFVRCVHFPESLLIRSAGASLIRHDCGRRYRRSTRSRPPMSSAVESRLVISLRAMVMGWSPLVDQTASSTSASPTLSSPTDRDLCRVETSEDFTRLATQLSNITSGPNIPTQSSVQVTEGVCPSAENSTFQASETLPPTPDDAVCSCLYSNSFSCVVSEATAGKPDIVGALTE
jgi:hypothetical protein